MANATPGKIKYWYYPMGFFCRGGGWGVGEDSGGLYCKLSADLKSIITRNNFIYLLNLCDTHLV